MPEAHPLLEVRRLSLGYRDGLGRVAPAVRDVSFTLAAGAALGLVGESGSGKSTVARALLGYLRGGGVCTGGEILLDGDPIRFDDPRSLRRHRGTDIAFVPQNPLSSLTYHLRVGEQLVEILRTRAGLRRTAARTRAIELLAATRLPDPERSFDKFPHQLSGGQRQRVVIACALACRPKLLVLDEPTTALDKTTEDQVLQLVRDLRAETGLSLVLVTHDLNVVASLCDQVLVMRDGTAIEQGATRSVFHQPSTPYTATLVESVLRLDHDAPSAPVQTGPELLTARQIGHSYQTRSWLRRRGTPPPPALEPTNLAVHAGEVLGVIGESGSGKSTLANIVAGLIAPSHGQLQFEGAPLRPDARQRSHAQQRAIQIIFQDPMSSLNPRQKVGSAIARPIEVFFGRSRADALREAAALLAELELGPEFLERYPRQLSGGQQQRVAIARAFAAQPRLIVCDEITSALDASIQSQVLATLQRMQERRGTALVMISHDLAVIWRIAQRVVVLRNGAVCEQGPTQAVFAQPASEYTRLLLASATRAAAVGGARGVAA